MREIVRHPVYGEIAYEESFWLSKKTLTVNGVPAQAFSKKEFVVNGRRAFLTGNFLNGVILQIEGETIQLSPLTKWYEKMFALLPLLFLVIWGNSRELCAIFPVVGGALGGLLSAVGGLTGLNYMKKQKSTSAKLLIGLGAFAATVFVAFVLALVLIKLAA